MGLVLRVRGCLTPCVPAGNVGNVDSSLWWAALLVGHPKVSRLPNRLQQGVAGARVAKYCGLGQPRKAALKNVPVPRR